jgi:hypothetical protein
LASSVEGMQLDADQFDLQVRQENRLLSEQDARRNAERLQAKMVLKL